MSNELVMRRVTEVKLLLPGGYGHPPPTQAPVQSAPGGGGYSSYEQNSTYGSGSYGQTPASTAYGSQPNANFSTPPAQGNFGGPPPTQGGYGGGPPSGGSYGGPPSSNGNYGGQGGGYNSKSDLHCFCVFIFQEFGTDKTDMT